MAENRITAPNIFLISACYEISGVQLQQWRQSGLKTVGSSLKTGVLAMGGDLEGAGGRPP